MIKRLIDKLHSIFDKSSQTVVGIYITSATPITVSVKDFVVTATQGATSITASNSDTLATFAATIASTFGATVTTDPNVSQFMPNWIVQGDYSGTDIELPYPTAQLYNEMQVYARALTEQAQQLKNATNQIYMKLADGEWLDYWGRDYFGILRYEAETDDHYRQRVIFEVVRPTQNNKAIEAIVYETIGVRCHLLDAYPLTSNTDDIGRFVLDLHIDNALSTNDANELRLKAENIVFRYRAAGTDYTIANTLRNNVSEELTTVEIVAVTINATIEEDAYPPGGITVGAGLRVGTPGLKVGLNNGLIEQIQVRTLNSGNDALITSAIYGG
jgi:hypothetical protein